VQWQAPSNDGGADISGYRVVDAATDDVLASTDASARSAVVKNLLAGRLYSFYVEAVNAKGSSDPSNTVSVTPQTSTTLTLVKSTVTVRKSHSYLLPGALRDDSGRGIVGASLEVDTVVNGVNRVVEHVTTHQNGAFLLALRPTKSMAVVVQYLGDVADRPASASLFVSVR
jgi:hypothetical protein